MTEPLETVLARRQRLVEEGVSFKICQQCNDVMRVGNATPLPSGAGGIFRDWIFNLYQDQPQLLPAATPPFRWIYRIYEKEQRLDRMVNRLLEIEAGLQRTLAEREQIIHELSTRALRRKPGPLVRAAAAVEGVCAWMEAHERARAVEAGVVV